MGVGLMNTNPQELKIFYDCLMQEAPKDYLPWFFPVKRNDKDPDAISIAQRAGNMSPCCNAKWMKVKRGKFDKTICEKCGTGKGSWKAPWARLTINEAMIRLSLGGNIGIAARATDPLTITDRDDPKVPDIKKETLTTISRKRTGGHWFGFAGDAKIKCNIPTENQGEHRSRDQYVVAAGSYVPVSEEQLKLIPEEEKQFAGRYTVSKKVKPAILVFEDLPQIFRETREKVCPPPLLTKTGKPVFNEHCKITSLFKLKISDIVPNHSPRFTNPLHGSETGANFSISDDGAIATCWRHLVTLNAAQFLAVKSGKFECNEIGKLHGGASIKMSDKAIFWAWHQAKKDGLLNSSDPIPYSAIRYIINEHKLCPPEAMVNKIPNWAKNLAYDKVESEY
jgi:putative DNA primase/helicase